jgi:GNAT superfamily N-acetyltransferase
MDASLTFEPLRPELLTEWLAFFEGPAFADNPEWGTCYCRVWVFGAAENPEQAWERACGSRENRPAMIAKVSAGEIDGLLARRAGEIVGWLHFGPASRFHSPWGTAFPPAPGTEADAHRDAAIVCFLVAATARRSGVARGMLRAALDELRARGFTSVSARAAGEACEGDGEQFTGPLALYLSEGFTIARPDPRRPTVIRDL